MASRCVLSVRLANGDLRMAEPMESQAPQPKKAFSGRARARTTRSSVRIASSVAHALISLGGIATILAVLLVCVFLVSVVVPLFVPARTSPSGDFTLSSTSARIDHLALNEYLTMGYAFFSDGTLRVYRLDKGESISDLRPTGDRIPTATAFGVREGVVAFGFADGSVQYGTLDFKSRFVKPEQLPDEIRQLPVGGVAVYEKGMLERTSENQFRLETLEIELQEPVALEAGVAVRLIDISMKPTGQVIAAFTDSNTLHIDEISSRKNLLTRKVSVTLNGGRTKVTLPEDKSPPAWLVLAGLGDNVFLAWRNGKLSRFDTRNISEPVLAEEIDIVQDTDAKLTAFSYLIGKTSLVSGDSIGHVRVWFRIKPEGADTVDGAKLTLAHDLPTGASAVTSLRASARTRMLAVGYADGTARLFHVTSNRLLAELQSVSAEKLSIPVEAITLSPKDDALSAATSDGLALWRVDAPYPEATPAAIFTPVWYEGYNRPEHVWQSSSGTDDFEPKYGLLPLVFGTIKATLYSMLFGVPLALLAAIYTSELMNVRLRGGVKTLIEMMAGLPSVVLGFLAALVVAPLVEGIVPEMLSAFATVPFAVLLGAYLWQLLPQRRAAHWTKFRLLGMAVMSALGLWLAFAVGPLMENTLFAGDIMVWLAGQKGNGTGGWMFILLPLSCLATALLMNRLVTPWLFRRSRHWSHAKTALAELIRYLLGACGALVLAWLTSHLLAEGPFGLWSFDPRGSFINTYVQRNALIVGFIMGFAIIPIIYTISEDALAAVPEHLRIASLGAGATPWQTAVRIIVPTAASGLFSAVMIGFGRAVGETMIVLMAAGNTPVMDWNIFNGFRTLSANIAVELPEAVKDSTHFRMLFLAALMLFVMTFLINTLAEIVRQRFRKRAFEI